VAGAPEGLGVDYARLLAGRVGIRLQFRPFTRWDDIAFGTGDKPIPFDLLVGQPTGRNPQLEYLNVYMESPLVLVALKGDLQIRDEGDLTHARIVIERFGKTFTDNIRNRFPEATLLFGDDARQALDMVAQGVANAYIGPMGRTRWALSEREHDDLSLLSPLPDIPSMRASLAVPRDNAVLAAILRKAEATVSPEELTGLQIRWGLGTDFSAPLAQRGELSNEDRRWLAGLGVLRVGYEADRYPYSFMDKDGSFKGLASDYMALIKKELGLRLEFVPTRDLDELQRRVDAKEVDVVAAAMPADFDSDDMVFSRPYERFPEVVVSRVASVGIAGPEDLRGKKVAVREEASLMASLKSLLPHTTLIPVVSNEVGLQVVENGQADAYIGTLPAIDALIRDRYAATLRVVAPAGLDQDIAIGVRRDKARLARLIDQVIAGIKDNDRQVMRSRWLRADYSYGAPWRWVLLGFAISALIIAIVGFAYKRLRDAEARARASERRLVDTNENLPGVVMRLYIDADNRRTYEYISGSTLPMFGMSREDILSGHAHPLDAAIEEDKEVVRQAVERSFAMARPEVIEFRTSVGGVTHWIRTLGGVPKPAQNGGYFWSVYCADVTAEKAQEKALVEAKATAEAAVAAKGAFLAMMSHEIRTPMAGVLSLVELLSRTPLAREQASMVAMVQESAVSLLQILDDILDFSRIDAERMELESGEFDLRLLTDGAAGMFAARAQQKGVKLYLTRDWRLASAFRGDANRLRQIINNLLSNALKFTQQGHVALRVDLLGDDEKGQRLRVSVSDTGIGISPDQLNRLFQPFVQAEASTTRRFGGTGLGLTICRRLATLMGGDVSLTSEVGRGTRACLDITLPVVRELAAIPDLQNKRALICVSDPLLEAGLANALSAMGLNVTEIDRQDASDFDVADADLYVADTPTIDTGDVVAGMPTIHVRADADAHGAYLREGDVCLSGFPLLWQAALDACRMALGLSEPASSEVASPAIAPRRATRVLVAEDHPINRAVIERQLELLGYSYRVVEDGLEAWQALRSAQFDLLITDCHMPLLDGYALTQRIRDEEVTTGKHLPIIALSASALPEQVEKCQRAGMDDFLAKPVRLDELQRKIKSMVAADQPPPATGTEEADQLAYLIGMFGSEGQLRVLLSGLVEACDHDISTLDGAIAAGNSQAQHELVHRMTGALRLIDPKALTDDASRTLSEQRDAIVDQLARIRSLMERLQALASH